jgi:hypothetical protein
MKIIEKEINGNNLVQAEDDNANKIVSKICLLLVRITMWLVMASKLKIERKMASRD